MTSKERSRQYYLDNRERLIELNKKNYLKNFELTKKRRSEYNKKWRMENKDKCNKYLGRYKEKQKEYRKNNKDKIRAYLDNNIEKVRSYKLMHSYNIDILEYHKIEELQEFKCAICRRHKDDIGSILVVDHDHNSNKIRGLLCKKCNLLIGQANDNINILNNAITYLNKHYDKN